MPIPHGTIDGDTTFWGTANVNCKIGYEPGGPAYCLDSGSWDTLPQCNPVGECQSYINIGTFMPAQIG